MAVIASSKPLTGFPCKSELIGSLLALLPGCDLVRVAALGRDYGIQANEGFWRGRSTRDAQVVGDSVDVVQKFD